MPFLLAPILLQVVTLGAADRLEARYTLDSGVNTFESSNETSALAGLRFDGSRASVGIAYMPSLTIVSLHDRREVLFYNDAFLGGSYRWKFTTLSMGVFAGFGRRDYRQELLSQDATVPPAGPQTPPPTDGQTPPPEPPDVPGQPGQGAEGAEGQPGTATSRANEAYVGSVGGGLSVDHRMSRQASLSVSTGYELSGGVDDESRASYPLIRTWNTDATLGYALDARNDVDTSYTMEFAWAANGTRSRSFSLVPNWVHRFTRQTRVQVGLGISYSQSTPEGWLTRHSVFPSGNAEISHSARLARGELTLAAGVSAAPVLDITTAVMDPRLTTYGTVNWTRERLSLHAGYGAGISLTRDEEGFSSLNADAGVSYEIGAGFSVNGGVREAWQRDVRAAENGTTTFVLDPTTLFYVGLDWGLATEFGRQRR